MTSVNFSDRLACRLCEKRKDLDNLFHENLRHVLKKLIACTDITIEKHDALPKFICKLCQTNLEFSYKFKIQCEYTDRKWRDLILEAEDIKDLSSPEAEEHIEELEHDNPKDDDPDVRYEIEYVNDEVMINYNVAIENSQEVYIINQDVREYQDLIEQLGDEDCKSNDIAEICHMPEDTIREEPSQYQDDQDENIEITFDEIEEYEDIQKLESSDDCAVIVLNDSKEPVCGDYNEEMQTNQTCDEPTDMQCDLCEDIFQSSADLTKHKKTSHKKVFQCKECNKRFSKRYHLRNHLVIHTGENRYKCNDCNKIYTNHGNLDRHIRVFHNKERKHICDTCGKGFSQLSILRQHRAVHLEERPFECDICNKTYKTQDYLNLHKELHKPREQRKIKTYVKKPNKKPQIKIFVCSYCGKKSNNFSLHQSHIRTHTGEKPYECKICYKKFAFQQSLRSHRLLHTGEKPFKCEACGLTFRQIGHLKGHQLIHTGEKKHYCLVCNKSFALRGNLTVHMRLHTGETPYHCTQCTKKFYDSNGLKRHTMVHNKQRANAQFPSNIIKLENTEYIGDENVCESYERVIENVDEIDTLSTSHLHYDPATNISYNILSVSSEN